MCCHQFFSIRVAIWYVSRTDRSSPAAQHVVGHWPISAIWLWRKLHEMLSFRGNIRQRLYGVYTPKKVNMKRPASGDQTYLCPCPDDNFGSPFHNFPKSKYYQYQPHLTCANLHVSRLIEIGGAIKENWKNWHCDPCYSWFA